MRSEFGFKMALHRIVTLILILTSFAVHAQKIDLSSGAKVEFEATGKPAMISIKGTGGRAKGVLEVIESRIIGDFILNLKDFSTDMDLRDEHMKEKYLEVGKEGYDKAILKINHPVGSAPFPASGAWEPKDLKGMLTLHGVTKEIPLDSKILIKDNLAKGTVSFIIKVQDFKIEIPSFAGITMTEEVGVKVFVDNKYSPSASAANKDSP